LGAFIAALILVSIFLRSIPLGLAVMVPAVLPVVVSLGVMGFSGIPLDVGRCMIAAIVIGIAVDDGVHLMSHYRVQRMAGATARQAIEASVHHVGRAVVVTSVSLSLGWVSFVASAWETISSFGFFVSVAILGALAATLYVLPAVIFVFQGSDEETAVDDALERA
jgi:predicted RND superfamily exporter protein